MRQHGSSAAHTRLLREILAGVGSLPGVIVAANPCGVARYLSEDTREFHVSYGFPSRGGPDILAALAPIGRLVALEVKTGAARATAEQQAVHAALRKVGVAVYDVRSVEEARRALAKERAS